jgi:hypothetical protein
VAFIAGLMHSAVVLLTARKRQEKIDRMVYIAAFILGGGSVWIIGELAVWAGVPERFAMAIAGGLSAMGILSHEKLLDRIIGKWL